MDDRRPTKTPVLVTGGTGTLGRQVVRRLREAGREVRVLSRGQRGRQEDPAVEFVIANLDTGEGVEDAVAGAETVIHCAGARVGDETKARELVRAASKAGVRHLVYISVIGDERVPVAGRMDRAMFGYFASKLAAGRVIAESGIPWTTLHASQFHDLTFTTVSGMARLPVIPGPAGLRFQPVDTGEVAGRLVELALGEPSGVVPDMAGPRIYEMADLVRSYLRETGKRRLLVPVRIPGRAAAAVRSGVILAPDRAVGRRTWEEFLAWRVGSSRKGASTAAEGEAR